MTGLVGSCGHLGAALPWTHKVEEPCRSNPASVARGAFRPPSHKPFPPGCREPAGWRPALLVLACAVFLAPLAVVPVVAAIPGQQQVTRDFQKTLTLGPGQSFRIENKFGEVRVHGESGRDVKISATIRVQAASHEEAESYSQKIQIEVEPAGDGLRVRTIYPNDDNKWFHLGKNASYSVNYDIALPSDAPLFVKNSFGSVITTGVHGRIDIDNSHGSLTVHDAGAARLNNSFGSIELTGAGGDAFINDNNGSVQASDVKGALDLRNRFGSITVRDVQGAASITGGNGTVTLSGASSATITTSFGSADVRSIRGDLRLQDNNGNVEIASIDGSANLSNSFGNVTFSDVKGRVDCTTNNGRVKGTSTGGSAVTIRDSFGDIELDNVAGALDAETSNGKIMVRDARGSVTLKTSFGAIEASNIPKGVRAITGNGGIVLTDIGADAYAKTSFGSILAERINGNLTAEDSNGSVTARNVNGDASVTTSFSGVTLESVGGRVTVNNQNGAIFVAATRPARGCRDISLKTSFSSIRVRVPDGVGYNVSAHTSFGRISSELPVTATGSMGGDSLNGTIGSGGCQLQLSDSNGNIEIIRAP
jgi:DUF4097 and DUF4098 domain-containing protein YvlB